MLLSFLLIQETLGHRFVHSTVLGSGIPNEPLELAKVATDPPPRRKVIPAYSIERKGLVKNLASDAHPRPQIARKLVNLNYNKCLDSVDVKSFPASIPLRSVYRHSVSSGAV